MTKVGCYLCLVLAVGANPPVWHSLQQVDAQQVKSEQALQAPADCGTPRGSRTLDATPGPGMG
jgi:hypothetical protein